MKDTVLFLCTGNYYRSRFAELLFNHWANERGLAWEADSRALALELGVNNVGPISAYAVAGLQARSITLAEKLRFPQQVTADDLATASLVIALDRQEHQPYVAARIPTWADQIQYWEVADLHLMSAEDALQRIEEQVMTLLERLAREQG
ncbi:MAG: low molecular weight phosphatase family protein [Caldilineaceae bacterium]|nr:low molecular weight phosphatase family protein [Caldilineaceae bacterium]